MARELSSKRGSSAKKKNSTFFFPAQFAKTNREPFSSMERMVARSLAFGFSDEARGNPTFWKLGDKQTLAPHPSMASERVPIPKKARIAFTIFIWLCRWNNGSIKQPYPYHLPIDCLNQPQPMLVLYIKSYEIQIVFHSNFPPPRMLLNSPISGRSHPPGQVASTMGSECTKTHIPTRPKRSTVFSNRPPAWRFSSKKTTEDNSRTLWKWVDSTCVGPRRMMENGRC